MIEYEENPAYDQDRQAVGVLQEADIWLWQVHDLVAQVDGDRIDIAGHSFIAARKVAVGDLWPGSGPRGESGDPGQLSRTVDANT